MAELTTNGTSTETCCAPDHDLDERALADDVRVLSALAGDTRYELLRYLGAADGGVCVCELPPLLGVGQSTVSNALSQLYGAELVSRRKEGRWRYYSLTPRAERLLDALDAVREAARD